MSNQQMCDDLMSLLNCVKRAAIDLSEERGLTKVQFFALYSLYQHDELAMGRIADVLHCDASNVTGIVDRLVVQDLVVRQESAKDRRTKTLKLTAKGRHAIESLNAKLPSQLGCDKLTENEQQTLHIIVQKICA